MVWITGGTLLMGTNNNGRMTGRRERAPQSRALAFSHGGSERVARLSGRDGKLKGNMRGHRKVRIPYREFLRFKNQRERPALFSR
jgi:hypothetical protein